MVHFSNASDAEMFQAKRHRYSLSHKNSRSLSARGQGVIIFIAVCTSRSTIQFVCWNPLQRRRRIGGEIRFINPSSR
ncbi:hypothetical protein L2E82_08904 [Cichorium intybus]|uniref:Uncharacterized protein n=1 Tax=Cichorium intybus TaxID=13427 RepID=A0ACB9G867_CICIN|nr:hypothetical protein L2E82_08904 [Cichorium intybus]